MDWRMGKKLIFFAHIVYFIAVCLHKTTAKISTFYQLKYDLFSIYFTLNCFFASLLFESDTTTALVPHHCLVDSVGIRRAKDFHPLENAHAEHNKTPNRHNHRLGADNNGVMIHLLFLHSLHAVHDIDAGREFVPLLGLLHARHTIDTLCVSRNVGCDVADAVSDWLNHYLHRTRLNEVRCSPI